MNYEDDFTKICSKEKEENLCKLLSEMPEFEPNKPGNIKRCLRKFILKHHPDKIKMNSKPNDVKIGNLMETYNACKNIAQKEDRQICDNVNLNFKKIDANKKIAQCIRKTTNWSNAKQYHKFDNKKFDLKKTELDIETCSPNLDKLLRNIQKLDLQDKKNGKQYKHFIYSDVKLSGHGSKMIAAGLTSINKHSCWYLKNNKTDFRIPDEGKGDTFSILCSSTIFGNKIKVKQKNKMLSVFNSRPKNIYGDDIRFVILDSSYKEGIDLFDIKYVHIFEPQLTNADLKQAVGRATRFCGQKGLKFVENEGWKLNVFLYTSNTKTHSIEELYSIYAGINLTDTILLDKLDNLVIDSAIDRDLNNNIHVNEANVNSFNLFIKRVKELSKKQIRQLVDSNNLPLLEGGTTTALVKYMYKNKDTEDFESLRKRINKEFYNFKYDKIEIENLCTISQSSSRIVEFTPSQNFISHYFVPENKVKGMLIYHSVGTGKTCTAIATKSRTWEKEDYTILWVTRSTLRGDIWKNMFDKICDHLIKDKISRGVKIPTGTAGKKFMSKNFLNPVSFAQFSNAIKAIFGSKKGTSKGSLYSKLIKRNGKKDPLKKTLIIIDEAHKLLAKDLIAQERPDFSIIQKGILKSYTNSKENSCRLLLMTATPFMDDPMDFIKLINLLDEKQIPDNTVDFIKQFPLNKNMNFSENSKKKFKELIKGKISYLNRAGDPRQFAQPVFKTISSNLSENLSKEVLKNYEESKNKCKDEYLENISKYDHVDNIEKQAEQLSDLQDELTNVDTEMKEDLLKAAKGTKTKIKNKYTQRKRKIRGILSITKKTLKKSKQDWKKIQSQIEKNKRKCITEIQKQYEKDVKEKPQKNAFIHKCKVNPELL